MVRPRQVTAGLRRLQTGGERPDRIGAGVDGHLGIEPKQLAARISVGFDLVVMLTRIGAGNQVFAAILDPAKRRPVGLSQPRHRDFFRLQQALVSKAAADIGRDHANDGLRQSQTLRKTGTNKMRHLRGCVDDQLPGAMVPEGENPLAFQRMHGLTRAGDLEIDGDRRRGGNRANSAVEGRLQKQIVTPAFVQLHGIGPAPTSAGHDGRQFVVVDLDQFRQILGRRAILADAHGHGLANETDFLPRQNRILRDLVAGNGGARDNGRNTLEVVEEENRMLMACRSRPRHDAGMRDGAAQERHLLQSSHEQIADELAATAQMPCVFLAKNARTDPFCGRCGFAHLFLHGRWRGALRYPRLRCRPNQTGRHSAFGTSRLS